MMITIVLTAPRPVRDEMTICNSLLASGLDYLHLRRPLASRDEYVCLIEAIEPRYRSRLVLHDYFDLSSQYNCGIHLNKQNRDQYRDYPPQQIYSTSCHSWEEVESLSFTPRYVLLSPIFDSISKQGYTAGFDVNEHKIHLTGKSIRKFSIIALGGINNKTAIITQNIGFDGIALLGYIWNNPNNALMHFKELEYPSILSIASTDPCSGAGMNVDIRVGEYCRCRILAVCSGITVQNEATFETVEWTSFLLIEKQIKILFQKYSIQVVKIGLIENLEVLVKVTILLKHLNPHIFIIWDPILKASAGYDFHSSVTRDSLETILSNISLVTPNDLELDALFGTKEENVILQKVSQSGCSILWKGGHKSCNAAEDTLLTPGNVEHFNLIREGFEKHGTGCIFSTAVACYISKGYSLSFACRHAQRIVSNYRVSSAGLLGSFDNNSFVYSIMTTIKNQKIQYITDAKEDYSICDQIEAVCRGGIRWVQLRMKDASDDEFLRTARRAKTICQRYGALFIINDRVDIAFQVDSDGVHLGKTDMNPLEARHILGENKIIGATCNTFEDVLQRQKEQVDYIGLGPFSYTTTKKNLSDLLGIEGYDTIIQQMKAIHCEIPIHAIGGITMKDIPQLMQTGISGIALSGLIKNSSDMVQISRQLVDLLSEKKD